LTDVSNIEPNFDEPHLKTRIKNGVPYFAGIMYFNFIENYAALGIMFRSQMNCTMRKLPNGDLMVLFLRRIFQGKKELNASVSGVKRRECHWITWRLLLVTVKDTNHKDGLSKCMRDNMERLLIPGHDRTSPFIEKNFRINA
jgi:hypothetical protein